MKVWIGFHCHYDFCNVWRTPEKVFDSKEKAELWEEDAEFLELYNEEYDWRETVSYELE